MKNQRESASSKGSRIREEVFQVKGDGTIEVSRSALHDSNGYREQVAALKQLSALINVRDKKR
ncbi:hypothetical protein DFR29_1283 [Tahibacter aquaticus]|uniref:Uncharacterized protein n=1 Tax=Tahibacter aquaticus TaxID=520092 RepID=A0A4R6YIN3_9GAMM|nr:hypothetical protein [Tahibacter aquaticus]TDR36582.1 hypothetical protein DFR29_1283 [Tahibacter aquaticus]